MSTENSRTTDVSAETATDLVRFFQLAPLNWDALPMLTERLVRHGLEPQSASITLFRYPEIVTYKDWQAVAADIRTSGEPKRYTIHITAQMASAYVSITIDRDRFRDSPDYYLSIGLSGFGNKAVADDLAAFLGLVPVAPRKGAKLQRSAFIAHRFNAEGEQVADRLARFLEMLAFDVKTGRGFSPESVSEKVRKRIETQAVVFVVLTPDDDETWLTQESVLGYVKDKPMFVLRDMRVQFKPALLGDLEYIAFVSPAVEGAFIAILEGLRELGYLEFK